MEQNRCTLVSSYGAMKPEQRIADAVRRLEAARADRDKAIRLAGASGIPRARIAELAHLSLRRVQQILAHKAPPRERGRPRKRA